MILIHSLCSLANALEEDGWPDDDPEIVDLSPLGSLRVLALRLHIFYFAHETLEHEIWTPFLWLLRSLATLPKSNSLEQITLHIVHVNSGEHPYLPIEHVQACILWEYFGPFLTKRFPYLRTVKLLLQAEVMPILRKIVDAEHPQAIELQERGLLKIEDWDAEGTIPLNI
jgi:hypothetical protein